jgi:hypothetical protein
LRLPLDRQLGFTVDHRFALSNPALVSAPSKKLPSRRPAAPCVETPGCVDCDVLGQWPI